VTGAGRPACATAGPDLFFGPDGAEQWRVRLRREALAKAVCAGCAVRRQCVDFALSRGARDGVWGGLGEDELRALQRGAWHNSAGGPRRRAA